MKTRLFLTIIALVVLTTLSLAHAQEAQITEIPVAPFDAQDVE